MGILVPKPMLGRQLRKGHRSAHGLVGYWLFNEGGGGIVSDLSIHRNTGTIVGTAPSWTSGKFGSVIDLPGDDEKVQVPDSPILNFGASTNFSISVWVKTTGGDVLGGGIVNKDGAAYYKIYMTSATSGFARVNDGANDVFIAFTLVADIWNHVVATFNRTGNLTTYVNGIQHNTGSMAAVGNIDNAIILRFGQDSARGFLDGQIDLPMIYNCALSASERAELYLRPFAMFDRMPIELWVGATSVGVPVANAPTSTIYGPLVGCLGGPI